MFLLTYDGRCTAVSVAPILWTYDGRCTAVSVAPILEFHPAVWRCAADSVLRQLHWVQSKIINDLAHCRSVAVLWRLCLVKTNMTQPHCVELPNCPPRVTCITCLSAGELFSTTKFLLLPFTSLWNGLNALEFDCVGQGSTKGNTNNDYYFLNIFFPCIFFQSFIGTLF